MNVFYRFSEESFKPRPEGFSKRKCLENFFECFPTSKIHIIADNVSDDTYEWLKTKVHSIERTCLKSGGMTFLHALKLVRKLDPETHVYLVEDDYMHLPGSEAILKEGVELADYATLYDTPDMYTNRTVARNGIYRTIDEGGEISRVLMSEPSWTHWKETSSTTLTFATKAKHIQEDYDLLVKRGIFSEDFEMFIELKIIKKKNLIVSLPGYSTHCHLPWITRNPKIFEILNLDPKSLPEILAELEADAKLPT